MTYEEIYEGLDTEGKSTTTSLTYNSLNTFHTFHTNSCHIMDISDVYYMYLVLSLVNNKKIIFAVNYSLNDKGRNKYISDLTLWGTPIQCL